MSWRNKSVRTRRGLWRLSSAVGVITPDDSGRGNHGTMVNAPTFARTPWGVGCMEFDGNNQYVNLRDLTYLNAVGAFTIAFWMNQFQSDDNDVILRKYDDATHWVEIHTTNFSTGTLECAINNGVVTGRGYFLHTSIASENAWHHVAVVFDGSQAGNINRLRIYVDGAPITLTFVGTIPTTTADLSGVDATIGAALNSFNGKLFDFQIHNVPLTRDEVNDLMRGHG